MITNKQKLKCNNCKELFTPDPRNRDRQKFCSKPECKKASKAKSQKRWLKKLENKDYFRGPENVKRVQQWRKEHPGYWKRSSSKKHTLQETLAGNHNQKQDVAGNFLDNALQLQDLLPVQTDVFIGLIANLTGSALQDDIAVTLARMQQLGRDILNPKYEGGGYVQEISCMSGQGPASPKTV